MPVSCELIAVRCSDTLETRGGTTECGVTALRATNAVKVFRAEKGRDKELIDYRFSGGFGYEIREKASTAKFTDRGFQLLCELISPDQSASLSFSTQQHYICIVDCSFQHGRQNRNYLLPQQNTPNCGAVSLQMRK